MINRPSFYYCFACWIVALATLCAAGDPYMITTGRGKYRIVEIPNTFGAFELTDDLKYAVVAGYDGYTVLSAQTGEILSSTFKAEPEAILQRGEQHVSGKEWKVVGNELMVGINGGWQVYGVPDLALLTTIPLPATGDTLSTATNTASGTPVALTMGWYCGGFFYDDRAKKPIAMTQTFAPHELAAYRADSVGSVLPGGGLEVQAKKVSFRGYDELPIPAPPNGSNLRFGLRWTTISGSPSLAYRGAYRYSGIYIEFVDHDLSSYESNPIWPFWNPPSMLLDKNADFTKWQLCALPQNAPRDCALVTVPSAKNELSSQCPLVLELNQGKLADADAIIARYKVQADREFELATGRKPEHIPFPFVAQFDGVQPLRFVLWADLTKAEILTRYCTLLKKESQRDLEARLAPIEAERADNQRQYDEVTRENKRIRAQEFSRKSSRKTLLVYFVTVSGLWAICAGSVRWLVAIRKRLPPKVAERSDEKTGDHL